MLTYFNFRRLERVLGENYKMKSFCTVCVLQRITLISSHRGGWDWRACNTYCIRNCSREAWRAGRHRIESRRMWKSIDRICACELIYLSLGRGTVVGCYELGNESYNTVEFLTNRESIVFSRRILRHWDSELVNWNSIIIIDGIEWTNDIVIKCRKNTAICI